MSIIEQFRETTQRTSADALAAYREIILRGDNPEPDDAVRLADVARTLGLTDQDIAGDVQAVRDVAQAEPQLLGTEQREQLSANHKAAIRQLDTEARQLAADAVARLPLDIIEEISRQNFLNAVHQQIADKRHAIRMEQMKLNNANAADDEIAARIKSTKAAHRRVFE